MLKKGNLLTAHNMNLAYLSKTSNANQTITGPVTFLGAITGNSSTATKLATGRTISLTGNVTGVSPVFDGSGNISFTTTIASNAITTARINNSAVTYAKIQNVTANRILGRLSSAGVAQELTAANVRGLINVADGADNYNHWKLYTAGALRANIGSGSIVNLKAGSNVTISYSATNNTVTISSSFTNTNTATAVDNILDGSNSGTAITYAPYTTNLSATGNRFYTHSTLPTATTLLNLSSHLRITQGTVNGSLEVVGDITGNAKAAIRTSDAWLRINPDSNFTNGVYSPKGIRADGGLSAGNYTLSSNEVRADIFRGANSSYYVRPANTTTSGLFAGSVGIGTTSPSYPLHVIGNVGFSGTLQAGTVPWARISGAPATATTHPTWAQVTGKPSLLSLGTTSSTAYRGDRGLIAYNHSQTAHAPSNANYYAHPTGFGNQPSSALTGANVISRITVNSEGHVTGVTSRTLTPANIGAAQVDGYTTTITITGDANTYYPVRIGGISRKTYPTTISIWKNLNTTTNSTYPGNHSNGTSSLWLQYEGRTMVWDGNGGYYKTLYKSEPYATLVSHTEQPGSSSGDLIVYLRGGTTEYKVTTNNPSATVTVYYSSTSLGSNATVAPRTSIGNRGIYTPVTTAYGNLSGNATTATTADTANSVAWANVSGKPSTFAPSSHTHAWSQITSVPSASTSAKGIVQLSTSTSSTSTSLAATASAVKAAYDVGNHSHPYAPSTHTHSNITITAGNGLSGGGALSANRTITLGTPGTLTNATTNEVTASSHTHSLPNRTSGSSSAGYVTYSGTTNTAGTFYGGTTAPTGTTRLNYSGYLYATRSYNAVYNDYAEYFLKDEQEIEAGDILIKNPNGDGFIKSQKAKSNLVVGVMSTDYAQCIGGDKDVSVEEQEEKYAPVGLAGRVPVKVVGNIELGDLIVSSNIPGVGMASQGYIPGTIVGKALENHNSKKVGKIEMLIMNI